MSRSLCIVGAGAAGVAAAYALRDEYVGVTVLEKSRGVCGRAATRRRDGRRYDHGASHLPVVDDRVASLVDDLGTEGRVELRAPVRTVTDEGVHDHDDAPRRVAWEAGMTQLAKRALGAAGASVERETRVTSMDRGQRGWRVGDADGGSHGPFDDLLVTAPAPQAGSLLAATGWSSDRAIRLREVVGSVDYRAARTVVLGYDRPLDREWFGLRVEDGGPVEWVGRESVKPGHVPGGEAILVVQMGDAWAREHEAAGVETVAPEVASRVASLVDAPWVSEPTWTDDQFWRYARPESSPPTEDIRVGEDGGLYFAGDWVAGDGRVDAALRSGLDVAARIER